MKKSLVTDELLREPLSTVGERLFIEGCDTVDLANRFGTPLFVVSEQQLRRNVQKWQQTFEKQWTEGPVRLFPALKANPTIAVRRILTEEDTGCDIFGPGELECALRGGVQGDDLSVNGSIKDRTLIAKAIGAGARIVIDSPREMIICNAEAKRQERIVKVLLRLKPDLNTLDLESDFVPGMQVAYLTQIIKYGIPTKEVLEIAEGVGELPHVDLAGIHVHMGRHSKKPLVWQAWVEASVALMRQVADVIGTWTPQIIDVGGGFPSPLDRDPDVATIDYETPPLETFAKIITETLRSALIRNNFDPSGMRLEIEPGRGIHADTGIHLTVVKNLKTDNVTAQYHWAEVDTAETFLDCHGLNLDRPAYDYFIANKMLAQNDALYDIVGQTCNAEILTHQLPAPRLESGDLVAFLNTGAYAEPNAANFNALPRPGIILVSGKDADLIRRAETVDDVFARDVVPKRFLG